MSHFVLRRYAAVAMTSNTIWMYGGDGQPSSLYPRVGSVLGDLWSINLGSKLSFLF